MRNFLKRIWRSTRRADRYHLTSQWTIRGTVDEVFEVLADVADYPQWWQGVFLAVDVNDQDGEPVAHVVSRGFLPYRIHFTGQLKSQRGTQGFTIESSGDFAGRGTWSLEQVGDEVHVTFDWKVRVEKRTIKHLSFLLKPLFIANHRWTMARGSRRLQQVISGKQHCDPEHGMPAPAVA